MSDKQCTCRFFEDSPSPCPVHDTAADVEANAVADAVDLSALDRGDMLDTQHALAVAEAQVEMRELHGEILALIAKSTGWCSTQVDDLVFDLVRLCEPYLVGKAMLRQSARAAYARLNE